MNKSKYLSCGRLTEISSSTQEIADCIHGDGVDLLFNIVKRMDEISIDFKYKSGEDFNDKVEAAKLQRNADEILESECLFGCSDYGILFCVLARAKGIPTKYIQAVDVITSEIIEGFAYVRGHVYCECYLDEGTFLIDPTKNVMVKVYEDADKKKLYKSGDHQKMIESFYGVDPASEGVHTHKDMVDRMKATIREYAESKKEK